MQGGSAFSKLYYPCSNIYDGVSNAIYKITNTHIYIYIEHVELTRDATYKKNMKNVRSEGSFA